MLWKKQYMLRFHGDLVLKQRCTQYHTKPVQWGLIMTKQYSIRFVFLLKENDKYQPLLHKNRWWILYDILFAFISKKGIGWKWIKLWNKSWWISINFYKCKFRVLLVWGWKRRNHCETSKQGLDPEGICNTLTHWCMHHLCVHHLYSVHASFMNATSLHTPYVQYAIWMHACISHISCKKLFASILCSQILEVSSNHTSRRRSITSLLLRTPAFT